MSTFFHTSRPRDMAALAFGSLALCDVACGQPVGDRLETAPIASLSVVLAPGAERSGDDPRKAEIVLYEIELGGRAGYVLDNGAEIGGRLVWRAQRDHPNRPGGSGSPVPGDGEVAGAFSGLSSASRSEETGPRGALETAFVYLKGGYGEISLGRDTGVAARFQEGNVDVFSMARASDTRLDPSGLASVITRADLTGPAEKISLTSPRLLGVRAGLSYTPQADRAGLDRNPVFGSDGLDRPDMENAWEVGLNATRRLRESGLRFRAGLGYGSAELSSRPGHVASGGSVEVWSAGGEITRDGFSLGASVLGSDDGLRGGDYSAWTLGLAHAWEDWSASLTFGESEADGAALSGSALSAGVARSLGESGTLTIGYQETEGAVNVDDGENRINRGNIVIELSLSL